MNTKSYLLTICLCAAFSLFAACSEKENPVKDQSLGSIDASVFVAVGSNYTAGMQSGALFEEGQMYSFPNLIATRLNTPFVQPLMPYPGTGELRILQSLTPPTVGAKNPSQTNPTNVQHPAPFNNLGIPLGIMADAVDESPIMDRATSRGNPFYVMVMRNQAAFGNSLVDQAIKLNPTIMTFWLGYNDVLAYAMSGGIRGTNRGLDGNPPGTHPTEYAEFGKFVKAAFAKIKAGLPNTKVVVGNIPNPTDMPYFTTVPRKLPNSAKPDQPYSIYYRNNAGNVTTVGPTEYALLTAQAQLAQGIGLTPSNPLPSAFVLDEAEYSIMIGAVTAYNNLIYTEALLQGFALVDMNKFFSDIKTTGYRIAGENYTSGFITGGVFSLDGVNLSARGNALAANRFIEVMNQAWGANIHFVQMNNIPGIAIPGTFTKRSQFVMVPEAR